MATAAADPSSLHAARPRALSAWLLLVAAMVFAMVVVGGITRLTESGLSIVRWEPISGALPPLSAAQWQAEFAAYRQSPQYQLVNAGMTLADFKTIFFWEYVHRLLGRVIGLVFALPLLWFAWKRAIPRGYGWKLGAILALGGLQGAIGWWMVASGLVDRPDVSHIRLAIHLLTALTIFAACLWVALDLRALARDPSARPAHMPTAGIWALSALVLQLMFGAYVAGLDAGFAYNSWPKMGDEWFPAATPMLKPALRNLVDNPIVVQFVHRWLAWAVAGLVAFLAALAWEKGHRAHAIAVALAAAAQIALGVATLLSGVDIPIAVGHQAMAVLLLAAILAAAHRLGEARA
ncbi:MAG: COX15/CtaA family protein [Alphaproteobacteria bacterium]|nr:COX15/CtaA family protein [Alphaproteobacteria bacterium]MBV9372611.1 COX15/CtaA family protein [Alphaproteobacteria bacterium]MBV9901023.1 COX15/CtaA family protein [Alphaproteobacteria bacterium]